MLQYTICEINKKQYKVVPNEDLLVNFQDVEGKIDAKVLVWVKDGKIQIGKPYLKEKITLKVLESLKGDKIRIGKFHAKANYRRTGGFRPKFIKVSWNVKTP